MEQQAIITVKDLRTYFYSDKRCNKVLNGVSFDLLRLLKHPKWSGKTESQKLETSRG